MQTNYDHLAVNLNVANNVRQKVEEELKKSQKENELLTQKLSNREDSIADYKKELEKTKHRLMLSEKTNDELEIKQESISKQSQIQRQQLNDKIMQQEQLLSNEKEVRENWISRFEAEQKAHVNTNGEFLKLRGAHQDLEMDLKNVLIENSSLKTRYGQVSQDFEGLQMANSRVKA